MKKYDVSIECAHLYADQQFAAEHQRSLDLCKHRRAWHRDKGHSVRTLVMIDDIHVSKMITDETHVRSTFAKNNLQLDDVIMESSLIPVSFELAKQIEPRLTWKETFRRQRKQVLFVETTYGKTPLITYQNGYHLPSCALLSASLSLVRLGVITRFAHLPSALRIITIIEERFRDLELRAQALIALTKYASSIKHIEIVAIEALEKNYLHAA